MSKKVIVSCLLFNIIFSFHPLAWPLWFLQRRLFFKNEVISTNINCRTSYTFHSRSYPLRRRSFTRTSLNERRIRRYSYFLNMHQFAFLQGRKNFYVYISVLHPVKVCTYRNLIHCFFQLSFWMLLKPVEEGFRL